MVIDGSNTGGGHRTTYKQTCLITVLYTCNESCVDHLSIKKGVPGGMGAQAGLGRKTRTEAATKGGGALSLTMQR